VRKLEHLDLIEDLGNLPRNLGIFLRKNVHQEKSIKARED
jgi:hypothetical protein